MAALEIENEQIPAIANNTFATSRVFNNDVQLVTGSLDVTSYSYANDFVSRDPSDEWTILGQPPGQFFRISGDPSEQLILQQRDATGEWIGEPDGPPLEGTVNEDGSGSYANAISLRIGVAGDDFQGNHNETFNYGLSAELHDIDFLTFTNLPAGGAFFADITSADFDPLLGWFNDQGNLISSDDNGGNGNLSRIHSIVPDSGIVTLAVSGTGDTEYVDQNGDAEPFIGYHGESGAYSLSFTTRAALFPIVAENAPAGTFVVTAGTVSSGAVRYELTDDADGRFDIDPLTGLITVEEGSKLDHEAAIGHDVRITTTDAETGAPLKTDTLTIFVRDINEAPTNLTISNNRVSENVPDGTLVGTAWAYDPDNATGIKYELTNDAGGRFDIDHETGQLTVESGENLDFEDPVFESEYTVEIKATDPDGEELVQSFTIHLDDVNEAPTRISPPNVIMPKKFETGTVVAALSTDDPDTTVRNPVPETFTYALLDDSQARFKLHPDGDKIIVADVERIEEDAVYELLVRSTDKGGLSAEQAVVISGDILPPPPSPNPTDGDDVLIGTDGPDTIDGLGGNDTIIGLGGADVLIGNTDNDYVVGDAGADTLIGNQGDDTLDGGVNNDSLDGGLGNDAYWFDVGDGVDYVKEQGGTDAIVLADGITPDDVRLTNIWNLTIHVGADGDQVVVEDHVAGSGRTVEQIHFAAGTVWDLSGGLALTGTEAGGERIEGTSFDDTIFGLGGDDSNLNGHDGDDIVRGGDGNDSMQGNNGNDTLDGGAGNDTLDGGADTDTLIGGVGNDTLRGGEGNDAYHFNLGDGVDLIQENEGNDAVVLADGIAPDDVRLTNIWNLTIHVGADGDQVVVEDHVAGSGRTVEELRFADGTVWDLSGGLTLTGTEAGGERIEGTSFDDTILGLGGDDSNLNGHDGDDIVRGGDGNDSMQGNNGSDMLEGGAGNDTLDGGADTDTLIGDAGNDTLRGGEGDDEYRFDLGDGVDWIYESDGFDAIVLSDAIAMSDVSFSTGGSHLIIHVGEAGDRINISNQLSASPGPLVEQLQFADGTLVDLTDDALLI